VNGWLVFLDSFLITGVGGSGGESLRSSVLTTFLIVLVAIFGSSESLEDELEDKSSTDDVNFLGPSESVALVSEPCTFGLTFFSGVGDLSDSEEEVSESDSGKRTFWAIELVDESESESDSEGEEESLAEEVDVISVFFAFAVPAFFALGDSAFFTFEVSSPELDVESELEADEDPFSTGMEVDFATVFTSSFSELESESELEEESLEEPEEL
jgi:hypothetical protein